MKHHEIFQSVISPKVDKNPLNVKSYTQVLQSLLIPHVAISLMVYNWSQYGEYGIRG